MEYRTLDSHVIESVKDELLPTAVPELEAQIGPVSKLLSNCPIATTNPGLHNAVLPFNDGTALYRPETPQYSLCQLSSTHQRSLAVGSLALIDPWHDEFGNEYYSLNLKGNNFSHAQAIERSTDSGHLSAYGLLESDVVRRILRGSRILRAANVGTEYAVGLAEPKKFPWPVENSNNHYADVDYHELVPLPEYKRRLVEQKWYALARENQTPDSYVELSSKLEHLTFYIMLRAMDTSYRLADIRDIEQNKSERKAVFDVVNRCLIKDGEMPLDFAVPEDFYRFGCDYLVPRLARNIAKMHKMGLAHGYLTSNNISALGSIVDLDSLHGAPLEFGDDPITVEDKIDDIRYAMRALRYFVLGVDPETDSGSPFINFAEIYMTEMNNETELEEIANGIVTTETNDPNMSEPEKQFNLLLDEAFAHVFLETYNRCESVDTLFTGWVEKQFPRVMEELEVRLESVLESMAILLVDHYLDELNEDSDFDMVEALLKEAAHPVKEKAIKFMLLGFMQEWFKYYLEQTAGVAPETIGDQLIDPERLVHMSAGAIHAENVFREWHNEIGFMAVWPHIGPFIEKYQDKLRKAFTYGPLPVDFDDGKARGLGLTPNLSMLTEISGVLARQAVLHVNPNEAHVRVSEMPEGVGRLAVEIEGSNLHYIITDKPLKCRKLELIGRNNNQDLIIEKFEQQYILAVYEDREGKNKYLFYTKDRELLNMAEAMGEDSNRVMQVLIARYASQLVLFG